MWRDPSKDGDSGKAQGSAAILLFYMGAFPFHGYEKEKAGCLRLLLVQDCGMQRSAATTAPRGATAFAVFFFRCGYGIGYGRHFFCVLSLAATAFVFLCLFLL
jgi:hypothetical protein